MKKLTNLILLIAIILCLTETTYANDEPETQEDSKSLSELIADEDITNAQEALAIILDSSNNKLFCIIL